MTIKKSISTDTSIQNSPTKKKNDSGEDVFTITRFGPE